MLIANRSQRNLVSELTRMVEQVLDGNDTDAKIPADALLSTAIASFFPILRQFAGHTLQLFMSGYVIEVVFPHVQSGPFEIRENDHSIVRTQDDRTIVLSLAAAVASDPRQFERFALSGPENC